MTPHQHTQLKKWATDLHPKPGEGHLYDLLHEAIDAVVPVVPPPFYDPRDVAFTPEMIASIKRAAGNEPPSHAEAYAALNPKVGERFRVVRKVEPEGWKVGWYHAMDDLIGRTEYADFCNPSGGVYLLNYWFPANTLERVVK